MKWRSHDVGVCSWSLRPASMAELISRMGELQLTHVHLALGPLLDLPDEQRRLEIDLFRQSGLVATAGQIGFAGEDYSTIASIERTAGVVPDSTWPARLARARAAVELAGSLGIRAISFHLGFVPQSNDPAYAPVLARICDIAEPASRAGVSILLETGQESASELLQFFNDVRCAGVDANYDPANFLLYGVGDPIDAIATIGRHIRHVHLKDATLSDHPGIDWGNETFLGRGQVPLPPLLDALTAAGYDGPLVIECEFDRSMQGVRHAMQTLASIQ